MFSVIEVNATPVWARKIVSLSSFINIDLPKDITDLAIHDKLADSNLSLEENACLLYMRDWDYRGIIVDCLDKGYNVISSIAKEQKILIITTPSKKIMWKLHLTKFLKDKKICCCFVKNKKNQEETFDSESDIVITDMHTFYENNMISRFPSIIVIDIVDNKDQTLYTWDSYLTTLVTDLKSVIFFVGNNYYSEKYQIFKIVKMLWNSSEIINVALPQPYLLKLFLKKRDYKQWTMEMYSIFGVSLHLLSLTNEHKFEKLKRLLM